MKKRNIKIIVTSFVLAISVLCLSVSLTSCMTVGKAIGDYIMGGSRGIDTVPSAKDPLELNGDVYNNQITIDGKESNVTYATSAGIRSIVSIYCSFSTTSGGNSYWNPNPSTKSYASIGSGVIYSLDVDGSAFIITNYHVVYDSRSDTANRVSDSIYLYLYGMESKDYAIPATYVGGSANYDIAVLRVDANAVMKSAMATGSVAAATFGNSDKIVPGNTTIAIGNPSSIINGNTLVISGISATSGIVSVDSEYINMTAVDNSGEVSVRVIRTDSAVNGGNSGGGLFNDKGELIGIVNAKSAISGIDAVGYAIPSNVAAAITRNIIDYCYNTNCENVMRGMLGINLSVGASSTLYDTENGTIIKREDVVVSKVATNGLANGKLQEGDIVKEIKIGDNTTEVYRQHHYMDAMLDVRVGSIVSLLVLRGSEEKTVQITITKECLGAY